MMQVEKISGTQLFTGTTMLDNNYVLILKNNTVAEIIGKENAGENIKNIDGIICPGFVNAHCHLELSYLKNKIPQNTGMVNFILAVLNGRNTPLDLILQSIKDAEDEMQKNGIVAVGDICNTPNTILLKKNNNIHYTNFIEVSGFAPTVAKQRFEEGKKVQQQFLQSHLNATIVPHAPYSVSDHLFALIQNEQALISSIHYNESIAEKEFMLHGIGDFTRLYKTLGVDISFWEGRKNIASQKIVNQNINDTNKSISTLLVHNVVTNEEDIAALQNKKFENEKLSFCVCPNANIFIGNGLPNMDLLIKSGANICLGTDSLASNNQLSIAAEIKTIQKKFPHITLETILQWATINGAKALQIEDQFGSFEKGKSGKYVVFQNEPT
jgi:aminodeoxyfutalosine deaminase